MSITEFLNYYHGVNKSTRYWKIILGPWLINYSSSLWDHWENLRIAFNEYDFDETILFNSNPFENFAASNHANAEKLIHNNDLWNHEVYSRILKSEYGDDIDFKYVDIQQNEKLYVGSDNFKKKSIKFHFAIWFDRLLGAIQKNEKIVFFNTYINLGSFIKICLKIRCIPRIHNEFNKYLKMPETSDRSNLYLNLEANSKFEKFFAINIIKDMPVAYVEGFSIINNYVKDLSKKAEIIFTANAFWTNDVFKVFSANRSEFGAKIIISEHGGGIPLKYTYFSHEDKVSDIFAVWHKLPGISRVRIQPNIITKKNIYKQSGVNLLILGIKQGLYVRSYQSGIEGSLLLDDYNQKIIFIKSLNSDIKEKVKIRKFKDSDGWKITQRYIDDLSIENISTDFSFKGALNSSRVIVCTYPETTFLQSMHSNIPTILLFMKDYYELHPGVENMVQCLENANIIFNDPLKAAQHINQVWSNPLLWWSSTQVIYARKMFFEYCGSVDKDWQSNWISLFKRVV